MKNEWVTDKVFKAETNNDIFVSDEIFSPIVVSIIITGVVCIFSVIAGVIVGLFLLAMIVFRVHAVYVAKYRVKERKRKYENNEMTKEEKLKYEEDLQKYEKEMDRLRKLEEKKQQFQASDSQIDYTIIVGSDSRKSATSTAIRGAVGGAIAGVPGFVGGAASGKNNTTTTFKVVYKSGRIEVKTVKNNSAEFNNLAKYVR